MFGTFLYCLTVFFFALSPSGQPAVVPSQSGLPGRNHRPWRSAVWPRRERHALPLQRLPGGENVVPHLKKQTKTKKQFCFHCFMPDLKATVSSSSKSGCFAERASLWKGDWFVCVGSLSVLTQLLLPLISIGQLSNNSLVGNGRHEVGGCVHTCFCAGFMRWVTAELRLQRSPESLAGYCFQVEITLTISRRHSAACWSCSCTLSHGKYDMCDKSSSRRPPECPEWNRCSCNPLRLLSIRVSYKGFVLTSIAFAFSVWLGCSSTRKQCEDFQKTLPYCLRVNGHLLCAVFVS